MKIIIFGGSGFLGSHVADYFYKKKNKIYIFDKYKGNFHNQNYNFIKGDIQDKAKVFTAIK